MLLRILGLFLLLQTAFVSAQFGNLFDMFGQQQQQQQQRPTNGHSPSMWATQADAVGCATYLCPATLVCVDNPSNCPCPSTEQIKCVIPDEQIKGAGTVVCVSGETGCRALERFAKI